MEYAVVVIYTTVGAKIPLQNDYPDTPASLEQHGLNDFHGQAMYFPQTYEAHGNPSQGRMV